MDDARPDPTTPPTAPRDPGVYPRAAALPWKRPKKVVGLAAAGVGLVFLGGALGVGYRSWPRETRSRDRPELDPVDRAVVETDELPPVDGAGMPSPGRDAALPAESLEEEAPLPADLTSASQGLGAPAPGITVREGRVGRGFTMHKRLVRHGLEPRQAQAVLASLKGLYDFRRSRPEHSYRLELDGSGGVQRFRYRSGPADLYEVVRADDGFRGAKVEVPTRLERVRAAFVVKGSLAESMARAGLERSMLPRCLRAFDSEMRFQDQQRDGDVFRVVADGEYLDAHLLGYKTVWAVEYSGERLGRRRAIHFRAPDGEGRFYDELGRSTESNALRAPLNYSRISSGFEQSRLHPILRRRMPHNGVDFSAPRGAPVWATADGVARFVGRKGAAGNLVIIDHQDGLESIYAHLERFARGLERGQAVRQRQVIGFVGSTGRSTGPHLHFGLRRNGRFIDPLEVRSRPGPAIDPRYREAFRSHAARMLAELASIPLRRDP